jgi:hypothetical protein
MLLKLCIGLKFISARIALEFLSAKDVIAEAWNLLD